MTTCIEEVMRKFHAVSRSGVSEQEVQQTYANWAPNYDKDIAMVKYDPPKVVAEALDKVMSHHKDAKILDVAAGTGKVGAYLWTFGYRRLDAVDVCQEMLDVARSKNIYQRFICDYVGANRLDILDDTYDALVTTGSFLPAHMSHVCFPELIRVTRPGGYIVILLAEDHLRKPEFKDKLVPALQRHHDDGQWVWESTDRILGVYPEYDNTYGLIYTLKVIAGHW